jgi:hypothetical protein
LHPDLPLGEIARSAPLQLWFTCTLAGAASLLTPAL